MDKIELIWCESFSCTLLLIWLHLYGRGGIEAQELKPSGVSDERGGEGEAVGAGVEAEIFFNSKN